MLGLPKHNTLLVLSLRWRGALPRGYYPRASGPYGEGDSLKDRRPEAGK